VLRDTFSDEAKRNLKPRIKESEENRENFASRIKSAVERPEALSQIDEGTSSKERKCSQRLLTL